MGPGQRGRPGATALVDAAISARGDTIGRTRRAAHPTGMHRLRQAKQGRRRRGAVRRVWVAAPPDERLGELRRPLVRAVRGVRVGVLPPPPQAAGATLDVGRSRPGVLQHPPPDGTLLALHQPRHRHRDPGHPGWLDRGATARRAHDRRRGLRRRDQGSRPLRRRRDRGVSGASGARGRALSPPAPPAALTANVEALLGSGALLGSYTDLPLLPPGTNPRPYLNRNRVAQPFFIAASTGAVLTHLRGAATLHLRGPTATQLRLQAGDLVALPPDVPYRVLPDGECVQLIY